jgi:hypothetical protein
MFGVRATLSQNTPADIYSIQQVLSTTLVQIVSKKPITLAHNIFTENGQQP